MASLMKWEPFGGLTALRREMDHLFENFFDGGPQRVWEKALDPAVEVSDTQDSVLVKAQVPGINKENIQVNITDDMLTLKGEMKEEEKKEEKNHHRQEFRYGAFTRTIALPSAVQADKATAQLKDGILEISIPKSEQAKVKQIPVNVA